MVKKLLLLLEKHRQLSLFFFFSLLFIYILILFKNAFSVDFFLDDFFFVKIGHANSIGQFLHFFSPFKDYFYRPIPTETFYFLINLTNKNLFIAHTTVFIIYFLGLYYLYRVAYVLSKKHIFSLLFVFMYGIHYIHIFQLYQLATFIEVALFTFLIISFYYFTQKKYLLSIIFFILALWSKETAVLYPIALFIYIFVKRISIRKVRNIILLFVAISIVFVFFYKLGTSSVIQIDTYKIHLSPRLMYNNLEWYFLWSIGIPNFVPNYMKSIFFQPLPDFWNLLTSLQIRSYFYLLIVYLNFLMAFGIIFLFKQKKHIRSLAYSLLLLFSCFILFISPTLPIIHRWEVRLTIPLLFIIAIEAFILYSMINAGKYYRIVAVLFIVLYTVLNSFGIALHESSGLILYDSSITKQARVYFAENRAAIDKKNDIYIQNDAGGLYHSSIELEDMLGNQNFIETLLPGYMKKVYYSHKLKTIPVGSYVILSSELYPKE